jgi:NMD protein affecting ribosome stability and mRNA decay
MRAMDAPLTVGVVGCYHCGIFFYPEAWNSRPLEAKLLALLSELVEAKSNHGVPNSNGPQRMKNAWEAARQFLAAQKITEETDGRH